MKLLLAIALALIVGCSRNRPPIPPGTVPQQTGVSAADEQYGHDVLSQLTDQFPLDTDDTKINRVRDIADRLAMASGNDKQPWHVHVLKDDSIKNAAATRGNYLFVWSGMFNAIQDDTELATIIAHEMGHVLAEHTAESPEQEAGRILSGIMGIAAGSAVQISGYGGLSDLTQILVESMFEAALVNPQSQEDELEADHIGLFLLADAAYDPKDAVEFWRRVQSDPDFQTGTLQFFSSHPSTEERVAQLSQHIAAAEERYRMALGQKPASFKVAQSSPKSPKKVSPPLAKFEDKAWMVAEPNVPVLAQPDASAAISGSLPEGTQLDGILLNKRWLSIETPVKGYVRSSSLSPLK